MASLPRYELERWWVREWEKVLPEEGIFRFYRLALEQNLWGEWELKTSWGRIGRRPSRVLVRVLGDPGAALPILESVERVRQKRGYVPASGKLGGGIGVS